MQTRPATSFACCRRGFGERASQPVIARTEGVTASFLKELLRRSALIAATECDSAYLTVTADQLDAALDELLDTRNAMTRVLLGGGKD